MPTKYIIMKSSRAFEGATAPWAYRGPTCNAAGVTPGQIYENKVDAETDAARLTKYNPAGFVVLELKDADLPVQSS